ncbi:MAG: CDP-diacylglycerol--serine O-phosphatidyltransferase [Gammaproteobacteria bacterium]|nr:CDP-diacylglycerol--serine O-phosphatidyltransferase [Gammaproteobacteria bacterium]
MQDETKEPRRHRGIYLLPNLFTTAALFAGFYAIVAASRGDFDTAAVAIFVAMILDGMDGRIARLTNTQSDFGAQYDSLSDMIAFGLAPALVMYEWSLASLGKLGWTAAFVYTAAAALRLARFNIQVGIVDKRFFIGLPSPSAAALIAGLVWVGADYGLPGEDIALLTFPLTVLAGVLMVSNIRFKSFKDLDLRGRIPFVAMLIIVLVFVFISIDPPVVLFSIALVYALSGPVASLVSRYRRPQRLPAPPPPQPPHAGEEQAGDDNQSAR